YEVQSKSGAICGVEVKCYWDGVPESAIRVIVSVDSGGFWRALFPMTAGFAKGPDDFLLDNDTARQLRTFSGRTPRLASSQLADQLECLLEATSWSHDVIRDELASVPIGDPELDYIRVRAIHLSEMHAEAGGVTYFAPYQRPQIEHWIETLRRGKAK